MKVINRGKTNKTKWNKASWKHKWESAEFSRNKSHAKVSLSFVQTARPCIWLIKSFQIKGS